MFEERKGIYIVEISEIESTGLVVTVPNEDVRREILEYAEAEGLAYKSSGDEVALGSKDPDYDFGCFSAKCILAGATACEICPAIRTDIRQRFKPLD